MSAIRIALWALLATLIAVTAAAVALPLYLDTHKDLLAAAASRALGRDVRIDGAVGFAWLPKPSLQLQNVVITGSGGAGAFEGSAAPLPWRAGRLEAELDLAALFSRSLRITRILVHEALIDLDSAILKALPGARASSSPNGFGFAIDTLVLTESTLVLHGASGAPLIVGVDRLAVNGFGSPTLAVDGEVALHGIPVSFSASTGSAGKMDLDIAATLREASLTGDLSLLSGGERPRVEGNLTLTKLDLRSPGGTFNRSAATAETTYAWLDVPLPVAGLRALDLDLALDVADLDVADLDVGHLRIDRLATRLRLNEGLLRFDGVNAELSDIRLLGEAALDGRTDQPIWSADLTTKRIAWASGRLDGVSLSARAGGTSARELIESLGAELKADRAQLQGAAEGKGAAPPVQLTQPRLSVKPGAAVRLQTAATAGGRTFDLDLTGGALVDLIGDALAWPKLDVVVRQGAALDGLSIRGRIGPLAALVAGRQLDVDLSLKQPGLDIVAKGTLARLDAFNGSRLDVEAGIKDLAALDGLVSGWLSNWLSAGVRDRLAPSLSRGLPLRFSSRVLGLDRGLELADLKITSADSDLGGDLTIRFAPRPGVSGTLVSQRMDLTPYFATEPSAPGAAGAAIQPAPLPEIPEQIDGTLAVKIGHLRVGDLGLDLVELDAALNAGHLRASLAAGTDQPIWSADLTTKRIAWASGRLDGVSLSARAGGTNARELIESLGAELKADRAQLKGAAEGKGAAPPVQLTQPRLSVKPGAAVRLQSAATAGGRTFDLDLTGGALVDLVGDAPSWPKLDIVVRQGAARDGLSIRGRIGPLAALVAGRHLDVDLSLKQPGLDIVAKGTLARLDAFNGSRLDVEAGIKDLAALDGLVSGWLSNWLPDGVRDRLAPGLSRGLPLRFSSRVVGLDRGLELADLKITSADSDLGGDLTIRFAPRPRVSGTLVSQRMDLTPYFATEPSSPGAAGATTQPAPLPEIPEQIDGTLAVKIGHLRVGDLGLGRVELDAALDAGHLRASLAAGAERPGVRIDLRPERSGSGSGSGSVQAGWRFDIQAQGDLNLALLMETRDAQLQTPIRATLDARFTGLAMVMEDLFGHATGHLDLSFGSGQLHKRAAGLLPLAGLLVSLLDVLNPLNVRGQVADLQCAVMQFDVTDGIATSTQGLALQTREINAIGGGAINLRTEEIELRFKTTQRRGLGVSLIGIADRFVTIRGTLRDPQAGIDAGALLVQGGAAWATSGISLVADQLFRRLTATANPCDAVRRQR